MSLIRSRLFAGALFAGSLLHGASVEQAVIVEQPSGGVVRERVVKYESRKLSAHTYQQLSQESGARLYAIDNSRLLFAFGEQRLHFVGLGFCETEWVTKKPVLSAKTIPAKSQLVSTHYQLKQANTALVEVVAPIVADDKVARNLHYSGSVIRLQQQSVSRAFVIESIVAKCRQYRELGQLTVGMCEVSDDEDMLMVLLLLNEMDSSNHADYKAVKYA